MIFYSFWINRPVSKGESNFPPSIVDSSSYEPLGDIVHRMVSGGYVPVKDGYYDDDDYDDPVGFDIADADISDVVPPAGLPPVVKEDNDEAEDVQEDKDVKADSDKKTDPVSDSEKTA